MRFVWARVARATSCLVGVWPECWTEQGFRVQIIETLVLVHLFEETVPIVKVNLRLYFAVLMRISAKSEDEGMGLLLMAEAGGRRPLVWNVN